jgi:hypothetical protein
MQARERGRLNEFAAEGAKLESLSKRFENLVVAMEVSAGAQTIEPASGTSAEEPTAD